MQTSKYLLANERDKEWGLTVSTIGYEMIEPGESYPTKGHADGYYFDLKKGRELDEYQLLYQPEGEGVFQSAHIAETPIKAGDIFLLFPGEWHTYHPCPEKGWHSYWIGFKGKNIDDRVKARFLSPEKPIYHVGFSNDILSLYKEAYRIAQEAEDLGVSYSSFRKLFKEFTGIAPAMYQQDLRLQRAKELLSTTDESIKEIAYRLNFESPDYFSSKFKNQTGLKPSEFRNKMR